MATSIQSVNVGSTHLIQITAVDLPEGMHVVDNRTSGASQVDVFKVKLYLNGKYGKQDIGCKELDRDTADPKVLLPIFADDTDNPGTPLQYTDTMACVVDTSWFDKLDTDGAPTNNLQTGAVMVQLDVEWEDPLTGKTIIQKPVASAKLTVDKPA